MTFAEGVAIKAAGIALDDVGVAVFDFSSISQRLIGAPLTVVLGREVFDAARLEIDIEGGSIRAVSRDAIPAGEEVSLTSGHGLESLPIRVEGAAAVAVFDLGNGSEMLIGAPFAASAGLDGPDRIVGAKAGGGVGGEVTRKLVRLKTVEVAGVTFRNVEAGIDETETADDANVGARLLRAFRITVDYVEGKLWLDPR
ncbi:MAG: aspartyl protease family protein [Parvularculaceae bacterium]